MTSPPVGHPDDRLLLIAFNLSKLDQRKVAPALISQHLKTCPALPATSDRIVRLSGQCRSRQTRLFQRSRAGQSAYVWSARLVRAVLGMVLGWAMGIFSGPDESKRNRGENESLSVRTTSTASERLPPSPAVAELPKAETPHPSLRLRTDCVKEPGRRSARQDAGTTASINTGRGLVNHARHGGVVEIDSRCERKTSIRTRRSLPRRFLTARISPVGAGPEQALACRKRNDCRLASARPEGCGPVVVPGRDTPISI